ncbi:YiiQ family protein [Citrobacter farmeri]|uniref:YiiQ family protein n=1 Tax=Citrobacter farmeri TaxID=67824 RepID=UPI00189BA15A|nr:YiiQ family protein [Citrobacter farmeri]MBJ9136651.1 YiiQ family protein [Citrobacter farmeri]MDB2171054.1 YiiQ family protein [Citrobacter farmeri]MDB2179176.1 YiiQ family protein [Citrobacter farmeri]HCD7252544.1 YiiQ family protein [Citrobacter farmeri]HCD7550227.1 YiiQ family protein [Citrobacter farmeri]
MKPGCSLFLLLFSAIFSSPPALAAEPLTATTAPYLLAGAPTFDLSISQFRENFNAQNQKLTLNEFRAIDSSRDKANLTRAASKINENLYASTALERGTLKIKSMQITWLPIQGPEQKAAKAKALEYMAAVIRTIAPLLTKEQSQKKLQKLLTAGKNKRYYAETDGAIRYVVADNGEKGLTFAVEPIKLALSENLDGSNSP